MTYITKVDLSRQSKHFQGTDVQFSGRTDTLEKFSIKGVEIDTSGSTSGSVFIFNGTKYVPGSLVGGTFVVNTIQTTYSGLTLYITGNTLLPGQYYSFTFQTIHRIPNTSVIHTGTTETLVVFALSSNTISSQVYSIGYPQDIIFYDWDDNLCEDNVTPRPGRISYRKDMEIDLETWYDWRNVTFRRWKIDSTAAVAWTITTLYNVGNIVYNGGIVYYCMRSHTSSGSFDSKYWSLVCLANTTTYMAWDTTINLWGTISSSTNTVDYKTFNNPTCKNIKIEPVLSSDTKYNNIVFIGTGDTNSITIGHDSKNMTFIESITDCNFSENCHEIIMGVPTGSSATNYTVNRSSGIFAWDLNSNNIIDDAHGCTLYQYVFNSYISGSHNYINSSTVSYIKNGSNNKITSNTRSIIEDVCSGNLMIGGSDCKLDKSSSNNNFISSTYITIGINSVGNDIEGTSYSTLGNSSLNNTMYYSGSYSTLGNNCNSVSLSSSSNDTIGNDCTNITITGGSVQNIGNNCSNINFADSYNMNIGNYSQNITMNNSGYANIGNNCISVTGTSSNNTTVGNGCTTVSINCNSTVIGNNCSNINVTNTNNIVRDNCNNIIITNSDYNELKLSCSNILIQSSTYNTIGNKCTNITGSSMSNCIFENDCNDITLQILGGSTIASNNYFGTGCQHIVISGINNYFGQSASTITVSSGSTLQSCYFAPGSTQYSITSTGATYSTGTTLYNFKVLLQRPINGLYTKIINMDTTGSTLNNKVINMMASGGTMWYHSIDSLGNTTTVKFLD
jgi:hypothetical protein